MGEQASCILVVGFVSAITVEILSGMAAFLLMSCRRHLAFSSHCSFIHLDHCYNPQARASCSREFSGVVAKYKAHHLEMKPLKLPPVSFSPIYFVLIFVNCFIKKDISIISSYFAGSVSKRQR